MCLKRKVLFIFGIVGTIFLVNGCSNPLYPELSSSKPESPLTSSHEDYLYYIGPGDLLNIFVWRNPEVSTKVTVRPDGIINTPLVEGIRVSDKTPNQVAREIEKALSQYIKNPIVTVTIEGFRGPFKEQVRVIGQATSPRTLPYSENMTLLDLMIAVGGLTEFADGNKAILSRVEEGQQKQYTIRIEDLIQSGDLKANIDILPGDIVIIPEAWF
ncbi:MAG: polysaccharide export protein [Gammaproteobacteria bacterium]|nr:polysaccharide export protein [Gammaproteobacteria bacterium]